MGFNTYPYSPFPASTEQLHKGDNEDLQAQINAIKDGTDIDSFGDVEIALGVITGDITGLETDKADNTVIAPEFDAEAGVYAVGDLVMYQGKLYEFTTAHETAGAWDSTEVTEKTVADEINAINSNLLTLANNIKVTKENWKSNVTAPLSNLTLVMFSQQTDTELYLYTQASNTVTAITSGGGINATKSTDTVSFDSNNRGSGTWAVLVL